MKSGLVFVLVVTVKIVVIGRSLVPANIRISRKHTLLYQNCIRFYRAKQKICFQKCFKEKKDVPCLCKHEYHKCAGIHRKPIAVDGEPKKEVKDRQRHLEFSKIYGEEIGKRELEYYS